jgi:excisionase family DNA binding protein
MTTKANYPAVMSAKEVAAYLRISKQIVYRLIKLKKLPAFRIGAGPRDWRIYRMDVERFAQGGGLPPENSAEMR